MLRALMGVSIAAVGLVLCAAGSPVQAQAAAEDPLMQQAQYDFTVYCGSCHGASAKGDGPLAQLLTVKPPDLTQISKKNKGIFPMIEVMGVIDGRTGKPAHGSREMPVWGDAFWASEDESVLTAQGRISALALYLMELQEK